MTREEKYPTTKSFKYYNANPYNRLAGDCVIRALCTALGQSWEQTVRELTEVGIKKGYVVTDGAAISTYLAYKGWTKYKQPRKLDNTKYTGMEFCTKLQTEKSLQPIIANIGGHHIVAIIDGRVLDIWDSTEGCIGNYWMK